MSIKIKVDQKKSITEHCPNCTEVLFKNASFEEDTSFTMPCPHCKKPIAIVVRVEKIPHITTRVDDAEW